MRDLLCLHLSAVIPSYCDFAFLTKVLFLSICLANFPGSYSSHHSFFLPVLSVSHHTSHIHSKSCSYIILSYLFILYSSAVLNSCPGYCSLLQENQTLYPRTSASAKNLSSYLLV